MGNAKIYYYPNPNSVLKVIDLGEALTNLSPVPDYRQVTAETWHGDVFETIQHVKRRMTITLSQFSSPAIARDLLTFESHVLRGGRFGIAEDSAKAWAGYTVSNGHKDGKTALVTRGNNYYDASGTLVAGDEVVIQSCGTQGHYELDTIATFTDPDLTLTNGLVFVYEGEPVLVRHRGYWPLLRLPPDDRRQQIMTDNFRITYTIELRVEEDTVGLARLKGLGSAHLRRDTEAGGKVSDTQFFANNELDAVTQFARIRRL